MNGTFFYYSDLLENRTLTLFRYNSFGTHFVILFKHLFASICMRCIGFFLFSTSRQFIAVAARRLVLFIKINIYVIRFVCVKNSHNNYRRRYISSENRFKKKKTSYIMDCYGDVTFINLLNVFSILSS